MAHCLMIRTMDVVSFFIIIFTYLSTNKILTEKDDYVLVIARARVPHVGYWHGSDVEPEGPKARGLYVTTVPITYVWHESSPCNN